MTVSVPTENANGFAGRISQLRRKKFARQSAIVIAGTGLSQLLPILCAPILSRLYSPADFGLYGIITSIATIIAAIAPWGFDRAIAISLSPKTAANLLTLSLSLAILTTALVGILGYAICLAWGTPALTPEITRHFWLIPAIGLAIAITRAMVFWHTRTENHKTISFARVLQSCMQVSTQIATGLAFKLNAGLLYGYLAGQLAFFACLAGSITSSKWKSVAARVSFANVRAATLGHLEFPRYRAPQQLIVALGKSGYLLAFATAFSPIHAGLFTLAQRVLYLPIFMIAQSIQQVFIPKAMRSHATTPEKLEQQVIHLTIAVAITCIACILPVLAAGPRLFAVVFGETWVEAGNYARLLAIAVFFQATAHPAEALTPLLGIQRLHLYNQMALVVAMGLSIAIGYALNSPLLAVVVYAFTIACSKSMLFVQIILAVRNHASLLKTQK